MSRTAHFTAEDAAAWVGDGGERYAPTGDPVRAQRVVEPHRWTTASGAVMEAKPGDWIVDDDGQQWSVDAEVFAETYEAVSEGRYRKTGEVRARQIAQPTSLETLEGSDQLDAGDWVVQNASGECWGVSDARFRRRYQVLHD
ncbi:PGDYG domain-containing protein [Nesterenkonia sp. K-15-9-6]|uniref:PGDYG domain-containing protein n=1 Tax=Nesterenkonia sp. K-15-9-6 TaxID=3093918 RepID=UPI004043E9CE